MNEVERTIQQIEEARRAATKELISFKAGEKLMAARAQELAGEAEAWQRKAEDAVRAGDDELAREALQRRADSVAELGRVRADRDEQARIAVELLRSRRELDAKLASLKLRQGTVAAQIAAARGPAAGDAFDRFEEAGRRIEEDATIAELSEGEIEPAALAQQELHEQVAASEADRALAELKERMKK